MSLGSLIPPDTVEKRGLLRRPKNRKAIDVEAFEGGVEQNMLKRRGLCGGGTSVSAGRAFSTWLSEAAAEAWSVFTT